MVLTARGMLYKIPDRDKFIAANTIFKHKTSHITTSEKIINQKRIYKRIENIAIALCRKFSTKNARRNKANKVETDHQLVVVKMHSRLE